MSMRFRHSVYDSIHVELSWRLDFARAMAAGLVLFGHLRGSLLPAWRDMGPESKDVANYVLFFVTRLGHEAVMIFFVLSGFLVGGNALTRLVEGRFSLCEYMLHRLTRMYVVLLPALILGGLFDIWRLHIVGQVDPETHFGWSVLAGNLLFLQTILVEAFGRNAPLWSLAYEFWYYVLWGLLVWSLSWRKRTLAKAAFAIVLILLGWVAMPHIMKLFPVWLMGVAVRLCPAFFRNRRWFFPLSGVVVLCVAVANMMRESHIGELMVGLAFSGLIWHWMYAQLKTHLVLGALSRSLAAFSFSLYAIHYPIVKWLAEAMELLGLKTPLPQASARNWALLFVLAVLLYLVSWLFYLGSERHTAEIRARLAELAFWRVPAFSTGGRKS